VVTNSGPLWRRMADELTEQIRSGARAPGSKLPSVAEQDDGGVSQTTTLRAYRELVDRGLAVTVHGRGTFVADPLPKPNARPAIEELESRLRALEEWRERIEAANVGHEKEND
jgi:GntR family transcriptional regulator